MIESTIYKHVFWAPPGKTIEGMTDVCWAGGWGFWDEAEQLGGGPYATEEQAGDALKEYAKHL